MLTKKVYHDADGVRRTVLFDADKPGGFTVRTDHDLTQVVETNKAMAEVHPNGSTNKLVARVPLAIWERSYHENWGEDDWKRWLNDPDNAMFRVWKGQV